MNAMLESLQSKKCQVFAHRGANREAMENTSNAFDKALRYAIDGIETDVQLSRDEVAVLWHDRFLDKIGLRDKHIDDFDYQQLRALINPDSADESIMTLADFLHNYRQRCRLLIEVKNRDWEPVSRHQAKMRQTLDLTGDDSDQHVLISSFNLASLEYAHQYRAGFPLIYNFETDQTIEDARKLLTSHTFLHGFCLPIANTDQAIVDLLRAHDKCIGVYTCNSDAEITKALKLGVNILISDVPQKALLLRNQ
ncbi:glycerophosphodiester phosphodiesterase [Nitrosomonas sp.]|uniref:glycerophosphodiester phosphodiesterase n=1 Tax=Nitrosomonas sp. TaxID=42353 RepID=UPI001D436686|nr:glycerophosphodiester phosphodiesterase [Nitrosomonas sp.]MBX3616896.1 glycerophosphodiester phosphodiesterase [Nitrosomonas sp.]